jgi:hypothetical protein
VIVLTGAIVLVTLWLVNALGLVAGWVGLHLGFGAVATDLIL